MASQTKQAEERPAGRKTSMARTLTSAFLLLPVIAVLFPTCMVLASGMVPTLVAFVVDRTPGKPLVTAVGLMNVCGTMPGLVELWQDGQAYAAAARIATDPFFWAAAYGAAGVGWLIFLSLPPILTSFYGAVTGRRIAALRKRQAALVATWGEDVAQTGRRGTNAT